MTNGAAPPLDPRGAKLTIRVYTVSQGGIVTPPRATVTVPYGFEPEREPLNTALAPCRCPVGEGTLGPALQAGFDLAAAAARQHPSYALLPQEADEHGVVTLAWHRDRPFHPQRLYAALEDLACAAARSRGRFWLADRPDTLLAWDAAGGALCVESSGPWLAALPDAAWEMVPPERRVAASLDWHLERGDRCQYLTFTSPGLDRDGLLELLDSRLLTDTEYAAGPAPSSLDHQLAAPAPMTATATVTRPPTQKPATGELAATMGITSIEVVPAARITVRSTAISRRRAAGGNADRWVCKATPRNGDTTPEAAETASRTGMLPAKPVTASISPDKAHSRQYVTGSRCGSRTLPATTFPASAPAPVVASTRPYAPEPASICVARSAGIAMATAWAKIPAPWTAIAAPVAGCVRSSDRACSRSAAVVEFRFDPVAVR